MEKVIEEIRSRLRSEADDKIRESGEKFFKEGVKLYGIRNAVTHRLSSEFYKTLTDKSKSYVFVLCTELWKSGYNEEAFFACNWSYAVRKQFQPDDIILFGTWVEKYVTNWAICDTFCNHTVGEHIMKFPDGLKVLKSWAQSENRWLRRGAAVSLIIPARRGLFLKDIFEIANLMLTDRDDMVQKGYGWMLKAASEAHRQEVFDFVVNNKKTMPRTALRYAIEKIPAEMKKEAMKK